MKKEMIKELIEEYNNELNEVALCEGEIKEEMLSFTKQYGIDWDGETKFHSTSTAVLRHATEHDKDSVVQISRIIASRKSYRKQARMLTTFIIDLEELLED